MKQEQVFVDRYGVFGFLRSLDQEIYSKTRGLLHDSECELSLEIFKSNDIGLKFNWINQKGEFGTVVTSMYTHEQKTHDDYTLQLKKPGDLQSLYWKPIKKHETQVSYAPLNFEDTFWKILNR